MKTIFTLFLLFLPLLAHADDTKIYDTHYNQVGTIRESSNGDQVIYDTKFNKVGTIRDGTIYDSKFNKIGTVKGKGGKR